MAPPTKYRDPLAITTSVRLTPDVLDALRSYAAEAEMSAGDVIRSALMLYLHARGHLELEQDLTPDWFGG